VRNFNKKPINNKIIYDGIINAINWCSHDDSLQGFSFYMIIYNVEDIEPGIYIFDVKNYSVSLIRSGLFTTPMSTNLYNINSPKTASFTLIIVANINNLLKLMPYAKGLLDTYIRVGMIAQKLLISYGQYDISSIS
jgi:hypothetical protein